MGKVLFYSAWIIVAFFAACLVVIALSYFNFRSDYHFLLSKQHLLGNIIWRLAFYIHLFFGVISILSGLPLFFGKWISYTSSLHKNLGKLYIISILFFTGPTGLYLSFFAEGGVWATLGFICMSIAWMLPTFLAYQSILNKNIPAHYKWMIRSYAMTLAGVTLRLITPIGTWYYNWDYTTTFIVTSFACWIINLSIAELVIVLLRNKLPDSLSLTL